MSLSDRFLTDKTVAVQRATPLDYMQESKLVQHLRSLTQNLGWANDKGGAFENIIPEGSRVLVKPNFVLHENQGPWSFEAVITHPSLVRVTVAELLLSGASQVMVGDAPVQGCDFKQLLERTGLGRWERELAGREHRFGGLHDFRRTISIFRDNVRFASEDRVDLSGYVLFDLGGESLLEPVTSQEPRFRVTCYDPEFLAKAHSPGRHQYLITKSVLEADVVINLPKLKMHCKAGVTNALKNLVGINGNKEYLPHHRVGGSADAGDCYPGRNRMKRLAEGLYDFKNSSNSILRSRLINHALRPLNAMLKIGGDETGIEGSWSGNDTVWRMALDLNRILVYGRSDGTMADVPQRTILHVSDGIIAGQGRGPLAPQPFELGVLLAGRNPAAMDWVGALLLGLEPTRIPLLAGVFDDYRWPLTHYSPDSIRATVNNRVKGVDDMLSEMHVPQPKHIPPGWSSAVRSAPHGAPGSATTPVTSR